MLILCSCSNVEYEEGNKLNNSGVWISCYELESMLKSNKGFKSEFSTVIENCKSLNIKNLYVHTRAFGETVYISDYFNIVASCKAYDYDIFEYIVDESHKAGLLVHAWINPYRVSMNSDIEALDINNPAYKWLKDDNSQNDSNVCIHGGIFFNPASAEVRALILDGIRELTAKYQVDGVHFDDYFYPTQSKDFDSNSYNQYKNSTINPMTLDVWRRENVNLLVSSVYSTVKYINRDIIFSISPAASIEHNYNNLYADVSLWIKQGWVDEIIPQVYFGFEYPDENFRFEKLIEKWKEITADNLKTSLKIGLASYKAIPTLEADKPEWESNKDIIARQVAFCDKDDAISGYIYFSYSSLFGEKEEYNAQRQNILEYLNSGEK